MHNHVMIDYIPKNGRFVIHAPFSMAGVIRAMPNRRWDQSRKVWTAPAIRANAKYMVDKFTEKCYTTVAFQALHRALEGPKLNEQGFPSEYSFKLRPYNHQYDGLHKMFNQKAFALFMQMRTGKSKVFIDYASAHRMTGNADTVVVVCPYSIRKNWESEILANCPYDCSILLLDTSKPTVFDKWIISGHKFRWLIVGVESLAAGSASTYIERLLLTTTKAVMGVDESHKIKNPSANRTKECVKLGKMAERRVIMTGTPSANGPMDLFAQFEFLDPSIIGVGDFYSFRNRYAVMGGYEDKQIIGYQNLEELMEVISPFVYQVDRKDVFDLPPVMRQTRVVKMSKEQAALYKSMAKNKFVCHTDGALNAQTTLEKMLRLQEITGGVVAYENPTGKPKFLHKRIDGSSAKVSELLELLEDVDGSVIIWCAYREEMAMVTEALIGKCGSSEVVEVHGGVDEGDRHRNVYDLFQTKKARFLVGNAATGGVGLKMSAADTVVYYSNTFNYTDRVQSEDRTQSSDQTKSVLYIDLVCEGTVDELILEALSNKQDVSDYVKKSINDVNLRLSLV